MRRCPLVMACRQPMLMLGVDRCGIASTSPRILFCIIPKRSFLRHVLLSHSAASIFSRIFSCLVDTQAFCAARFCCEFADLRDMPMSNISYPLLLIPKILQCHEMFASIHKLQQYQKNSIILGLVAKRQLLRIGAQPFMV